MNIKNITDKISENINMACKLFYIGDDIRDFNKDEEEEFVSSLVDLGYNWDLRKMNGDCSLTDSIGFDIEVFEEKLNKHNIYLNKLSKKYMQNSIKGEYYE